MDGTFGLDFSIKKSDYGLDFSRKKKIFGLDFSGIYLFLLDLQ